MNNSEPDHSTMNAHGTLGQRTLKYLTASSILCDKVYDLEENHLGDIKDFMVDLDTGKIEYLIIELGGYLGMGEKYFALPYSSLKVNATKEAFILEQGLEKITQEIDGDNDHWPEILIALTNTPTT
jgi:sporulation protein YlmC with PRC-barrel domain